MGFRYHDDPDQTAAAHRGDRLFSLGDIGYLDDDGYLFIVDRAKDMIITGGTNVYPAEIEGVLLDHPSVQDCAVLGIPDPDWGETVAAVVQPAAGVDSGAALEAELVAHCKTRLGSRASHARTFGTSSWPGTEAGKLGKKKPGDESPGRL